MNILKSVNDKVLHFAAGFLITFILSFVTDNITALGGAIVSGIAKECYDEYQQDGVFNVKDMVATWIGGCVGFALYAMLVYWGIVK